VPTQITIWDWLFDSPASPISRLPANELAGYQDAVTGERLNWQDVRDASKHISTALVKKFGYKPGQALALFSRNTIWYPVTMFAAIRVGELPLLVASTRESQPLTPSCSLLQRQAAWCRAPRRHTT